MEILALKNLSFSYPESDEKALDNITLSIKEGDFILLCGASGSGKTTLLKMFKRELTPHGAMSGEILFRGKDISELSDRDSVQKIGFVFQNPEKQIVTDKVWHELAFGLESLGFSSDYIRLRVGETASYFGITPIFRKDTALLSGGQQQMVCLASVMAMSPNVLLLDEPTSQLDPISANEFINTVKKLNTELGITVIMTEHRLQDVFPAANRIAVLENGRLQAFDAPAVICEKLKNSKISLGFPSAVRIRQSSKSGGKYPLTVKEGRVWLNSHFKKTESEFLFENITGETAVILKNIFFRYTKNSDDVLRDVSFEIHKGEHFCLLGANGSGKTTLLKIICGRLKPYRGKIFTGKTNTKKSENNRNAVLLPQNPDELFIHSTVYEDLSAVADEKTVSETAEIFGTNSLLCRHPYDLSGGELQKVGLQKILLTNPKIFLLDEPSKGLDAQAKIHLGEIIKKLKNSGAAVLTVTHDVEFAAEYADMCGLFFDGELLAVSNPREFFSSNNYYTTAASRISRERFSKAVTVEQVISEIRKQEEHE